MTRAQRFTIILASCVVAINAPLTLASVLYGDGTWWRIRIGVYLISALGAGWMVLVHLRTAQQQRWLLLWWVGGLLLTPLAILLLHHGFDVPRDAASLLGSVAGIAVLLSSSLYIVHATKR